VQRLTEEKAEVESLVNSLQQDIEDLKRSNAGFEKENISLVRERNATCQSIAELRREKQSLETQLAESRAKFAELLEAKDSEATKFTEGINKLIKFKN